jgi:hypothetical protein
VGSSLGLTVGNSEGLLDGLAVGSSLGIAVGKSEGLLDGVLLCPPLGIPLGAFDELEEGLDDGDNGATEAREIGITVRRALKQL